jgi:hypothetical protein
MSLKAFAIIAAGVLGASSVYAADQACCATTAANQSKKACASATFANLNLTPAQKGKMEKLAAECDQAGCTKQSMAKMEKGASRILSKEQLAAWKMACGEHSEKTRS